ncbi:MAG TPA: Uma2 family endonuclease [Armatimonadota bacterium]|nr:Uma2 family endonuclease [Armatimonadota bacterium]
MSIAPAQRIYTEHDLERLTARGLRYELIEGSLVPMSPAGGLHGSITGRLTTAFQAWIDDFDLGVYFVAETGFRLGTDPDTVLAPDWAFIAGARLPGPIPDAFVPVAPDLVLETRSPADSRTAVEAKVRRWLDAGVTIVLDLDPREQILLVHRPGERPLRLDRSGVLELPDLFPGLQVRLERVFRQSR